LEPIRAVPKFHLRGFFLLKGSHVLQTLLKNWQVESCVVSLKIFGKEFVQSSVSVSFSTKPILPPPLGWQEKICVLEFLHQLRNVYGLKGYFLSQYLSL